MDPAKRNFFQLTGGDGETTLINLGLVRMIDQISETHCRLWFSETHQMEINGVTAGQLVLIFIGRNVELAAAPGESPTER